MSNCPWCGSPEKTHLMSAIHWKCGSYRTESGKRRWQSGVCRIRELEAEAAGVEGLLAACEAFGIAERDYNAAAAVNPCVSTPILNRYLTKTEALGRLCREYAKAKEKPDG